MEGVSIYVHIPFCRSRCVYCDFVSNACADIPVEKYVDAVMSELAYRSRFMDAESNVTSVYIGGGTPSLFPAAAISSIVTAAAALRNAPVEITVEMNPGDVNSAWIDELTSVGVNRFSLGVQAMSDERLAWLGRRHSVADAVRGLDMLKAAGVDNISLDFIYATPGQTTAQMTDEVRRLCDLEVGHVSAYELTIADGTPLAGRDVTLPDEELRVEQWVQLGEVLSSYGLQRYEVSNFAVPGKRSVHNGHYWRGGQYLGIGAGAHGFVRIGDRALRYGNGPSLPLYLRRSAAADVNHNFAIFWGNGFEESLSELDLARERIMLGLRCVDGIDVRRISVLMNAHPSAGKILRRLVKEGMLLERGDFLVPSAQAMLVADTLALQFF
ncbi:MAG: radical SAM family heme chaperone HemW [Deltaproteobacteria bacterium]|nr:radical SAM family heme chaperone HemW [Deltaproteobacteria bacterium]MBN2670588.1 radical SAM family heme chaperone HemW [Deltaproteobacteria bacterium]